MDRSDLVEFACERLDMLTSQAALHQNVGNELNKLVCLAEARELAEALDSEDRADEIFTVIYHRYASESFGVDFEVDHGDPELMFGGV